MLSSNQFKVMVALINAPRSTQRDLSSVTGLSLGTISSVVSSLRDRGALSPADNEVTDLGRLLLEPYRVENAVIMAAGLSSRFAPISYEKPKGLLTVRDEVLVERQIRQLREAGVGEIYLVLGYKKEEFFYLEDKFDVRIRINEEYLERNNNSTIKCVEDILGNSYICSSDDYFISNPFERYVYQSYYSGVYVEGPTKEYCFDMVGREDRVRSVTVGGRDSWVMLGHAYWDRSFSATFVEVLNKEYRLPETASKLWEDIYIAHINELPMVVRKYDEGDIWEFDSLDEVSVFDPSFIQNVDSTILDNICEVLECERLDIHDVSPLKQGNTNLSFRFSVAGESYVYRHPGEGTEKIINRSSEIFSEEAASGLGLDGTFIYEHPEGWKLSHFVADSRSLDCGNWDEVRQAIAMARRLHRSGYTSPWSFDLYDEAQRIVSLLDERSVTSFKDFADLIAMAEALRTMVSQGGSEKCLCHNALYDQNFLVSKDGKIDLIDWEYSGMSDYGSDLGTFVCCSGFGLDEAMGVYREYFEHDLTAEEARHCLAYTALASFYWFVWALYAEACGSTVGEWLYRWYRSLKEFGEKALAEEGL